MIYLGIDYGDVRIGLAKSDEDGRVATPYKTIVLAKDTKTKEILFQIATVINTSSDQNATVEHIVVGLPLTLSGDDSLTTLKARRFTKELKEQVDIPVTMYDERYSSKSASAALRATGANSRKMRGRVDEIAAAIMLQSFLDGRR